MRPGLKRLALWVPLAIVAVLIVLETCSGPLARQILLSQLRGSCAECQFDIYKLDLSPLGGDLNVYGLRVIGDPQDGTAFEILAKQVRIQLSLSRLLKRQLWVESLYVDGFALTLIENGNLPPGKDPPSYPWVAKIPALHVDRAKVNDAKFTYAVVSKGHRGWLTFDQIDGESTAFGTRPELSPGFMQASVTARQGKARIRVSTRIGLHENEKVDDIEIWAAGAQLSTLDTLFLPEMGMRLKGELKEGSASIRMRGRKLTGRMELDYSGLELQFLAGYEHRSPLMASLLGLVTRGKVIPSRKDDAKIATEQEPLDGAFKFLLEWLKKGVFEIALRG